MSKRQIILDTETTGLDPKHGHRIIEVGCVELINRRLTGNNFHFYLNPEREVEAQALAIHGITNEFLLDKPRFSEVAQQLIHYVQGAELIIHNAPFDVGFINHEFNLANQDLARLETFCEIIDTLVMARQMFPGQKNNLDALCKRYNIDNRHRTLHGGLRDATILAQVYLAMTGGQGHLFESAETVNHVMQEQEVMDISHQVNSTSLPVIFANPQELKEHLAYLEAIKASEGLWD